MKRLPHTGVPYLMIAGILMLSLSCGKSDMCTKNAKLKFAGLDEDNLTYYQLSSDTAYIRIPQFFTPNGDGKNDRLIIETNVDPSDYDIEVFNDCIPVYKQNSISPDSAWNGSYLNKKKDLLEGRYDIIMNFRWIDGKNHTLEGEITLLRD